MSDSKRDIKIAILETKIENIGTNIDEIKNNHLVHIYDRLSKLEKKLSYYIGGLAVLMLVIQFLEPIIIKILP